MTTLAHLSDLHFGKLDHDVAEALLEQLRTRNPDLIVVSGDFTQRARRREFEAARAYVDRFPSPPLVVPGNHDVANYHRIFERIFRPLARYKHYIEEDLFPMREVGDVSVLGINTARWGGWYLDWSRGRISKNQLEKINAHFAGREGKRIRILVSHHPFIFPPEQKSRHLVKAPSNMLKKLNACGVDLVLAGHFHKSWSALLATRDAEERAIVVAQASTSTSTRLKEEPNAYNWIEIEPSSLNITSHEWKENAFEATVSKRYRREESEWIRAEPHPR